VAAHGLYYSVALQNKTKTPRALAMNCTWSQFMFDGVGRQRGEHEKGIASDSYAMGPIKRTPPGAGLSHYNTNALENNYTKHRHGPYNSRFAHGTF
jgi:hypothetical protein